MCITTTFALSGNCTFALNGWFMHELSHIIIIYTTKNNRKEY